MLLKSYGCLVIAISLGASLIVAGCKKENVKPTPPPPVKVKIMEVTGKTQGTSREYSGTIAAAESTTVSFSVAGTITDLYVKQGDKVVKGQVLGKVKNGEYLNAYNIAEAQLAEARDGYDRLKKLHDANALPDVKWVEIQQKLKEAENMAEMAKRTLDDATLHSPTNGTVSNKLADVGETVVPVQPVYEIVSTSDLNVEISVSENELADFEAGQKALITFENSGINPVEGKVSQKAVVADPLTRTFTVKIDLPTQNGKLLPGMLANVRVERNENSPQEFQGIEIPSQAVQLNDDNRWFVWLMVDSVAQRRFVTADELTSTGVIVTSGLNPGDKVIVEGMQKVGTGTIVTQ